VFYPLRVFQSHHQWFLPPTPFNLGFVFQGKLEEKDFNIEEAATGSNKASIVFNANVTDTTLEIRLYWNGKGTTCIPKRGNYGPLISAITVCSGMFYIYIPRISFESNWLCDFIHIQWPLSIKLKWKPSNDIIALLIKNLWIQISSPLRLSLGHFPHRLHN